MATLGQLISAHDKIEPRHRRALDWFLEHEGQQVSWPAPLDDGTLLATKAKGIYKPEWSSYALSVRQALDGPYPDLEVEQLPDGSWHYKYFQEGLDLEAVSRQFTNRGLIACMKDAVPVGVLIQKRPKPNALYLVQGVAFVDGWGDGYFHLAGLSTNAVVLDRIQIEDGRRAGPSQVADRVAAAFDPRQTEDARRRVLRQVVERRGQPGFRSMLLNAYGGRCVATGYDANEALEAAHIVPYRGPLTNHLSNGLLFRGDIHTLFDLGLVAVHEAEHCLILSRELRSTRYAGLHGTPISQPADGYPSPSAEALKSHRAMTGL